MTTRFPGLVITDWRNRLVHDHPRLFPDAHLVHAQDGPALSASGWPAVPDGWRSLVENACRRLDAAIASEPDAELVILDIKEKYGGLRLSISCMALSEEAGAAAELAIDLAEAGSLHVCEMCGQPGRLSRRRGWYATRCERHADAFEPVPDRQAGLQILTHFVDGRPLRSARRYDPATDSFVPVPLRPPRPLPLQEEE